MGMHKANRQRRRFVHQHLPIEKTAILDSPDMGLRLRHVFVLLVVIPLLGAAAYGVTRLIGTIETSRTLGPATYESR